jgi:hypothetical protein
MTLPQCRKSCNDKLTEVRLGRFDLYFSYETLVAFHAPGVGLVVSENCWGPTTGRHLNDIAPKADRKPRAEFERLAAEHLKPITGD